MRALILLVPFIIIAAITQTNNSTTQAPKKILRNVLKLDFHKVTEVPNPDFKNEHPAVLPIKTELYHRLSAKWYWVPILLAVDLVMSLFFIKSVAAICQRLRDQSAEQENAPAVICARRYGTYSVERVH